MFHFDLTELIKAAGYLGLFAIVFAESGLFIGFLLPGDSLLFTAGFLASQDFLNIVILAPLLVIATMLGDNTGYAIGRKLGPALFRKEESLVFSRRNLERANHFFEVHGRKTIIIARFVPGFRTFIPMLAGVGKMQYQVFFLFSVIGSLLWAGGLTILGYLLGETIPNVDRYLLPIIAGIIILSVLPAAIHMLKDPETREQLLRFVLGRRENKSTLGEFDKDVKLKKDT